MIYHGEEQSRLEDTLSVKERGQEDGHAGAARHIDLTVFELKKSKFHMQFNTVRFIGMCSEPGILGKRGACYTHGYVPRQLCDTFLVPSLGMML